MLGAVPGAEFTTGTRGSCPQEAISRPVQCGRVSPLGFLGFCVRRLWSSVRAALGGQAAPKLSRASAVDSRRRPRIPAHGASYMDHNIPSLARTGSAPSECPPRFLSLLGQLSLRRCTQDPRHEGCSCPDLTSCLSGKHWCGPQVCPHQQLHLGHPLLTHSQGGGNAVVLPRRRSCLGFSAQSWATHKRHKTLCGCHGLKCVPHIHMFESSLLGPQDVT